MFHNPKLYEHLKAAAQEASDLIKNIQSGQQAVEKSLYNTPSFVSCVRYLMEDLTIERLTNFEDPEERMQEIKHTIHQHIVKYLGFGATKVDLQTGLIKRDVRMVHELGDDPSTSRLDIEHFKEFNEESFYDYYFEYEKFLYSSSPVKYCIVAALENFNYVSSHSTCLPLSNTIRILPSSQTFYSSLGNGCADYTGEPGGVATGLQFLDYRGSEFLLEIDYEMEKEKVPSICKENIESVAYKKVGEVLKTLKLYKEGDLRCGWIGWFNKTPCDPPYDDELLLSFSGDFDTVNEYLLQEEEVKDLCLLFQIYQNAYGKKDFPHSAIDYLNDGLKLIERSRDKLVYFVSGLESLFGVGENEIKHKLAERIALFLEKDRQLRRKISKDIEKAYDLRSCIVHGRLNKIDPLDCEECTGKTEKYLRKSISLWLDKLEMGCTAKDIHDEIESERF